jgi:hypothetical protein
MTLKPKMQNRLSFKLLLIFFSLPLIFKAQNTIPATTVNGCLNVTGTSRIDSSLVVGDTMRSQDIVVSGDVRVAGDVNVGGNLLFKNGTGINVTSGSTPGSEIYSYGRSAIGSSPSLNPCFNPNAPFVTHQFSNAVQIFDNGPSGYTGGNILTLQSWFNGSSIDIAVEVQSL